MKKTPVKKSGKKSGIPVRSKKKAENDADNFMHEEKMDEPANEKEIDPDDSVHTDGGRIANPESGLEDPDDLVHGYREEDDE